MGLAWYFDSWDVLDGAAFASLRVPMLQSSSPTPADRTVFISMPDLEPVPIGRISTALSASRHRFQLGLFADEVEVPFESLEEIVEMVRVGYLGGGLGPGGVAAPPPGGTAGGGDTAGAPDRVPPELGPDSPGAVHYENAIDELGINQNWYIDDTHGAASQLLKYFEIPHHWSLGRPGLDHSNARDGLARLVVAFAESVTIAWERFLDRAAHAGNVAVLADWYSMLLRTGVWSGYDHLYGFAREHHLGFGQHFSDWPHFDPYYPWHGYSHVDRDPYEIVSSATCPRRVHWASGIERLADKLLLPMCDVDYFEQNPALPDLAPAVLGAMLTQAPRRYDPRWLAHLDQSIANGLAYLAKELPTLRISEPGRSQLMEFVWGRVS